MQKFHFKLNGLLKVREFREKKLKIELGEILKSINEVEERIIKLNKEIDESYNAFQNLTKSSTTGRMVQFFPYFVDGKREDIKNNESKLYALKKKYEHKIQELRQAKGEVKVIENLKEKKQQEWKKEFDKKLQEELEEFVILGHGKDRNVDGEAS